METITKEELRRLKPVCAWGETDGLVIRSGTNWLSITAPGGEPQRLRGEKLNKLRATCERILCWPEDGPGRPCFIQLPKATLGIMRTALGKYSLELFAPGGASLGEYVMEDSELAELISWLAYWEGVSPQAATLSFITNTSGSVSAASGIDGCIGICTRDHNDELCAAAVFTKSAAREVYQALLAAIDNCEEPAPHWLINSSDGMVFVSGKTSDQWADITLRNSDGDDTTALDTFSLLRLAAQIDRLLTGP